MASKISPQHMQECIRLAVTNRQKIRNFTEGVDLQLNLLNYDCRCERRFGGSIKLPNNSRPNLSVCVIADLVLEDSCRKLGIATLNIEDLKRLNKSKKLIKKVFSSYDAFLASETLIKTLPRVLGPQLGRIGKFPTVVRAGDDIPKKIHEIQSTVKFQLKRVPSLAARVGHVNMSEEEIRQNVNMAINFFVSLLKKNWRSLRSVYLKTTMGRPQRLY
eukprot:GILI01015304.1.p1 GENE.GILI01015304.1~~GILI01015304.1.p1  ORF type:complete len:232 (-),score=11.47 GILI01015304.1:295-945(-)